ncbi:chromate transporter [Agathobacter rectalis]|uniref:Chromate transporter n=1 Tax=Agathobacter rectalis TaxID=39491 RepID=A0A413B7N6_9FIRM|nr:chromate transporter [Agathobacter rectalis]
MATVGCVFPSCVIVMTLAYIYYRFRGLNMAQGILAGLRPAVIAMIASAGISLLIMALYGQRTLPNDLASLDLIAAIIFVIGIIVLESGNRIRFGYGRFGICRNHHVFTCIREEAQL